MAFSGAQVSCLAVALVVCLLWTPSVLGAGTVSVTGPSVFARSSSATYTVTLSPAPTAPTQIRIVCTDRLAARAQHTPQASTALLWQRT
jgi:hypothetical protein